jgi:hypothetical protein
MGYDVYGINPKINIDKPAILNKNVWDLEGEDRNAYFEADEEWNNANKGVYFRNNVWYWRPLWDYVCEVCEDVMSQEDIEAGWSNSGTEISASTIDRMTDKLMVEIALGNHFKYEEKYAKDLEESEEEECTVCKGTGERDCNVCNACNGKGMRKNFATNYPFSGGNVEEFVEFLMESGGIQIC